MSERRLDAFLDDLAAGRRPRAFRADAEDTKVLGAAIALRAERPGDATPDQAFVASLRQELFDRSEHIPGTTVQATKWHRGQTALFGVAAALALLGGTVAVTEASTQGTVQQSSTQVPQGQALRTATFEAATGQVMGQIVVFHGHPSWVFMNVEVPNANGAMICELHLANGAVVAAGTVELHDGKGEITKAIRVDAGQLRTATLSNPSGEVLASATFA
jgi:hypothetical protein